MTSDLRLVWVYPDLLSTYGDRGNLIVLERRARLRDIGVESVFVNSDQPVPRDGDIYLLGGADYRRCWRPGGCARMAAWRGGEPRLRRLRGARVYELLGHEFGAGRGVHRWSDASWTSTRAG